MPIRAYLDGLRFDPEAIRLMGIAFEMALVALQRTDGIVNPTRDAFRIWLQPLGVQRARRLSTRLRECRRDMPALAAAAALTDCH